jgi:hypothetical protein
VKVTISHRSGRRQEFRHHFFGLIKKVVETDEIYFVDTVIELSEEERAILATYKLWNAPLDTYYPPVSEHERRRHAGDPEFLALLASPVTLTVTDFIKDPIFTNSFPTPAQAQAYAGKLRSEILPKLKKLIESNGAVVSQSESFEL